MTAKYYSGCNKNEPSQSRCESLCFLLSILICFVIAGLLIVPYTAGLFEHEKLVPAQKINPNSASAVSLSRLPGIGMVRAEAILSYRREVISTDGRLAFENYKDLEKVQGIGPKTAQKLNEWLKFE